MIRRLAFIAAAGASLGAQDGWLPPSGQDLPERPRGSWERILFTEAGFSAGVASSQGSRAWNLALDGRGSGPVAGGLAATVSARLDWDRTRSRTTTLSLREAFLGWTAGGAWTLDAGRMQVREGVALGFNPTDTFRRDALPDRRSPDPDRLKASRLGVLGARAQYLKGGRGFVLVLAPGLGPDAPDPAWHDPLLGATNRTGRAHLTLIPGTSAPWYWNLILDAGEQGGRLAGLNATRHLGEAFVLYGEAARVKRTASEGGDGRWFGQGALGATCATPWRQTFALEYRFNGARPGSAMRFQEPGSRDSLMAHARWDRFPWEAASLTALWEKDLNGGRASAWVELACRRPRTRWTLSLARAFAAQLPAPAWTLQTTFRIHLD